MIEKIISGGQSGADKAALVAAFHSGVPTGGFAPKGYRVSSFDNTDSVDLELKKFGLIEHESRQYPPRTKANVIGSDGTLILGYIASPGCRLTIKTAKDNKKPYICNPTIRECVDWLFEFNIKTLNVAGNRLSAYNPGIYHQTYAFICELIEKSKF